jgi:archaellum component FlaC
MNKKKRLSVQAVYCLSNLLLDYLDELDASTDMMRTYKDSLTGICEELNNIPYDTGIVQRGTHFQELSNKINTLIRKNGELTMATGHKI